MELFRADAILDPDVDSNDTGLGFLEDATELIESNSPLSREFLSRTVLRAAADSPAAAALSAKPTLAGALIGLLLLLLLLWLMMIVFDSALIATILGLCSDLRPNWRGIVIVRGGVRGGSNSTGAVAGCCCCSSTK